MAASNLNMQKASGGILNIQPVDGVTNTSVTIPESGNLVSVGTAVTDNAIARYDGTTGKLQNSGVIIDDAGNVGIGTISPLGSLHIVKNGGCELLIGSNTEGDRAFRIRAEQYDNADLTKKGYALSIKDSFNNRFISVTGYGDLLLTSGTGALGYGAGAGGTVTQLTSKSTTVTLNKPNGRITMHNAALAGSGTVVFQVNNSMVSSIDNVVLTNNISENYSFEVSDVNNGNFRVAVKNESAGSLSDSASFNFMIIKGSDI